MNELEVKETLRLNLGFSSFDIQKLEYFVNLLTKYKINDVYVRVRSSGKLLKAKISKLDNFYQVQLNEPELAVSPGQACVFYKNDKNGTRLLGGGWIKSAS